MSHSLLVDTPEAQLARQIADRSWSYRESRTLQVTHRLGIFQRLGRSAATSATVAADLGLRAAVTEKLLIACAAMGLVERDTGDAWRLSQTARTTLLPDSPYYQGHTIGHMSAVWTTWHELEHSARGDAGSTRFDPEAQRDRGPAGSHEDFIMAMHGLAVAGQAAAMAERLDLSGCRRLIDVGGGPGTYSIALCQKYPHLKATVFDLPQTLVFTRQTIDRFGMAERVDTVEGNWDDNEFGQGFDVVLMSNILHGPTSGAAAKLAKAHHALAAGGRLVIQDFVLNAAKTGPLRAALFNIMVGAYSIDELCEKVRSAGFSDLRHEALPEQFGTMLLTARR